MSRPHDAEGLGSRWAGLHERLERVRRLADARETCTPDQAREILLARARALAQPVSDGDADGATPMVLVRLGAERFALAASDVCEVFRLSEVALLPGAAPPLAAVTVHRGDLLMLIDLRRARSAGPVTLERASVVVVQSGDERFGVLVDEVLGIEQLAEAAIHVPRGEARAHVRGVTDDAVTVLETRALTRATT